MDEMPEPPSRKPFLNAANKIAYYFDPGMTDEEAYRALLDPACHTMTSETHVLENGDTYQIVRVSRQISQ